MDRTVFIPHLPTRQNPVDGAWVPTISLRPAAELGALEISCEHPSDSAPENFPRSITKVRASLNSITDEDFILMAGDPVICAYAISYALERTGVANVLRWNRETRRYEHITIEE